MGEFLVMFGGVVGCLNWCVLLFGFGIILVWLLIVILLVWLFVFDDVGFVVFILDLIVMLDVFSIMLLCL